MRMPSESDPLCCSYLLKQLQQKLHLHPVIENRLFQCCGRRVYLTSELIDPDEKGQVNNIATSLQQPHLQM